MVYIARKHKLDEFSRRCMLSPIELQENLNEDKQIHKPTNPNNIGPTEMAKEYLRKETEGALDVIKDMCNFTAVELSSEPDIRRGLKKHIYEFGVIITEPTEKGKKELDVFHASYRTKRVNKRVSELLDTDLFIDILQNHSLGLITFDIVIKDDCQDDKIGNKYFQNMLEKYRFPDDTTKWRFLRREIFEIISSTVTNNRGQKSFLLSIVDEIKQELTEDAEKFVLRQSAEKYKALIQTGFFTLDNQRQNQDNDRRRPIEEDIIKQRERLTVMGAIMHPIDNRNFVTTIAVVD
jgi:transcription elongation factor SPT6